MLECKLHASRSASSFLSVRLMEMRKKVLFMLRKDSPRGMPVSRQVAANAPADAPEIFCNSNCGAYFLKQTATPTVSKEGKSWRPILCLPFIFRLLTMINAEKSTASERKIVLECFLQLSVDFLFHFLLVQFLRKLLKSRNIKKNFTKQLWGCCCSR